MKWNKLISMLVLALLFSSCHSKKIVAEEDPIYYTETEDYIFNELAQSLKNKPSSTAKALLQEALSWRGVPYAYGGESKKGVDCSGLMMMIYKNALGIVLPRSSTQQAEYTAKIKMRDLKVGDLLFYRTTKSRDRISHVGMYVGDGNMIHASGSQGVIIVSIYNPYFQDRFDHAGRIPLLN